MLRTTQLRFVAIVLFAVAAASLTTASARAFSLGNGGTTGGGNAAFAEFSTWGGTATNRVRRPSGLRLTSVIPASSNGGSSVHTEPNMGASEKK